MTYHTITLLRLLVLGGLVTVGLMALVPDRVQAQDAKVFHACRIPDVGVIYMIKEPGLPDECLAPRHVEFSWPEETTVGEAQLLAATKKPKKEESWSLTGNSGTDGGATNFLGTSDNQALELHVNGARALRLEPNATSPNLIGGFSGNSVTAGVFGATIGGGGEISLGVNSVTDIYGTVGGGRNNQAGDGPGPFNSPQATVGGGIDNTASSQGATVGGGQANTASGTSATVGGGLGNNTSDFFATVGGGSNNTASGFAATVPGGEFNVAAGDYSFAAGRQAKIAAAHDGSFLFADHNNSAFNSATADEFAVRASGGFRFRTSSDLSMGCNLTAGSAGFVCTSDRNRKQNFRDEDGEAVLTEIGRMTIQSWNWKGGDQKVRHLGPTAQDFYAAFRLGEGETTISTVDLDGVNMLAVQALGKRTTDLRAEVAVLREQNAELLRRLMELEAILGSPATADVAQK